MIPAWKVKYKLSKRFYDKVKFDSPDKCWEWSGAVSSGGYGSFNVYRSISIYGKPKTIASHRYMFMRLFGKLPTTIWVLHKCDNPKCVNPNHLYSGTGKNNADDREIRGRGNHVYGSRQHLSKLNERDIPSIRERLKNGETQLALSKLFGVANSTISRIERGETWKQVP